jgi:hypothetical protein
MEHRFELRTVIFGIAFGNADTGFFSRDVPEPEDGNMTHIHIVKLRIVSYEKVPTMGKDPNVKDRMGYILKDQDNWVYYNQYPVAIHDFYKGKPKNGVYSRDFVFRSVITNYFDVLSYDERFKTAYKTPIAYGPLVEVYSKLDSLAKDSDYYSVLRDRVRNKFLTEFPRFKWCLRSFTEEENTDENPLKDILKKTELNSKK